MQTPLKSILKKSVGNWSKQDDKSMSERNTELNGIVGGITSPEEEDEDSEEEEEEVFGGIVESNSRSALSDFQIPTSESFYGEDSGLGLGLGFDSLDLGPLNAPDPIALQLTSSYSGDDSILPVRSQLSNSARALFDQKVASNPAFEEEELEMQRLAAFVLHDAGVIETNSSDEEEASPNVGSPYSIMFDNASIYNYSPNKIEHLETPGTSSAWSYTEDPSSEFNSLFSQSPLLTSPGSSVMSLSGSNQSSRPSPISHLPRLLESHPDSPLRDFQFQQSFIPTLLPLSPPLPVFSRALSPPPISSSPSQPQLNERRFSLSAEVEEMVEEEPTPTSNYVFDEPAKVKSRPPPLNLAIQTIIKDSTPSNQNSSLVSPTSDASTPSLLLTSSTGSSSSLLTPRYASELRSPLSATKPPGFFDMIPAYNHRDVKRPNNIPPLSAELMASLSSSTCSNSSIRKRVSNPDLNRSLAEPTFFRERNFSEPIIAHTIIAYPVVLPSPTSSQPSPRSYSNSTTPTTSSPLPPTPPPSIPLPLPPSATMVQSSPLYKNASLTSIIKEEFQPLPMNSPSQPVVGSPPGLYSPNGEVFMGWGSIADLNYGSDEEVEVLEGKKEKEEREKEREIKNVLSQSSSSTEDDEPLARKPGAFELQKSLREPTGLSPNLNLSPIPSDQSPSLYATSPITQEVTKVEIASIDSDMPLALVASKMMVMNGLPSPSLSSTSDASRYSQNSLPPPIPNINDRNASRELLLSRISNLSAQSGSSTGTITKTAHSPPTHHSSQLSSQQSAPRRPSKTSDQVILPSPSTSRSNLERRPSHPPPNTPPKPSMSEFNSIPQLQQPNRKPTFPPALPGVQTLPSPLSSNATSPTSSSSSAAPVITRAAPNALAPSEHRIFVIDHSSSFVVKIGQLTRCGEIVMGARSRGLLTAGNDAVEGGFALWEICRGLGVERPIREFESLADVISSWNNEVNILVIRRTTLSPLLSVYVKATKISVSKSAYVQLELKKGKWAKRYLELKNGALFHSKAENGKDFTPLCQLSAFDVFFVAQHTLEALKAPKPCVFALKSLLPRAHYEDSADYCYYVSVKTDADLQSWVKIITEARNVFVRQREQLLINNRADAEAALSQVNHIPAVKLLSDIPTPHNVPAPARPNESQNHTSHPPHSQPQPQPHHTSHPSTNLPLHSHSHPHSHPPSQSQSHQLQHRQQRSQPQPQPHPPSKFELVGAGRGHRPPVQNWNPMGEADRYSATQWGK